MKIKMLKDMAVAPEGHTVKDFKKDDELDIDDIGGQSLIASKCAVEVEVKAVGAAPENKDAAPARSKKSK